jgi:hypothetical protein
MSAMRAVVREDGTIEILELGSDSQYVRSQDILRLINKVNSLVEEKKSILKINDSLVIERDQLLKDKKKITAQRDQTIADVELVMECLKNISDIIQDYDTNSLHHAKTLQFHRKKLPVLWYEIDRLIEIYREADYYGDE